MQCEAIGYIHRQISVIGKQGVKMDVGHIMPSSYMEHGFCLNWEKPLLLLHVGSDIITGISYYSIPIAMFYFAYRRRDLPFLKIFIMFAVFILSCGTTHFFAAYTIYRPEYWGEGYVKAFTAIISALTAIIFIPRIPEAIAIPSIMSSMEEIKKLNSELRIKNAELQKAQFSIENVEKEQRANERRMACLYNISQYPYSNEQELLDHALNEVIDLTYSKFGYIYFYNEQSRQFTLNTWSRDVMRECSVAEPKNVYDLDSTGIWGEAVRQKKPILLNDFQAVHPLKKGYPEGHVELSRFLTVPIIAEEAIVAVVGVGNKEDEYTDTDVMQLKLFMDSVWMITMRKRAEKELLASRKQYLNLVEGTPDLITRVDTEGRLIFVNHASLKYYGLAPEECIGRLAFDFVHPDDREGTESAFKTWLRDGGEIFTYENRQVGVNIQGHHHMVWSIRAEHDENGNVSGFASTARDITDRKHAEEENVKLEDQIHQIQKMESVGRLAGGVAHDFNNMLGVILGHASLALAKTDAAKPLHDHLEEIMKAAERSADLTRQLLAFARKQTIAPKVLDLNDTVAGMLKMLQRLIGEDINLTWQPAANLWPVKVDPSQIDQILANLSVNSRDSIVGIGKITIETGNCVIDESYTTHHIDFKPGKYVTLTVSDDGCGMDKETMTHIFEPFFTTKGVGEGTGLGLATVFGAVKQNNGFINVYSEPGLGTKFTIYLPSLPGEVEPASPESVADLSPHGQETVLLVEDEPAILNMAAQILVRLGYTVLQTNSPKEAIRMAKEQDGVIDLLITDVIMPEMNGKDLADNLQSHFPLLKCLYMSGYTADVIARHGVLDEGVYFIQKPFSLPNLATKVRDVLDGKKSSD